MTMFNALKDMMRTPVAVKPCVSVDTRGDKVFGDTINTVCMVESRIEVVQAVATTLSTKTGPVNVSQGLLYIDGSINISPEDVIIFMGTEHNIKRVWANYEGDAVSIWVVYF